MENNNLENRIKEAQSKLEKQEFDENNYTSVAGRLIIDLIAGIIVGGFLGYFIDENLGTSPMFLVLLIVLGSFGGLYSFYKDLNRRS